MRTEDCKVTSNTYKTGIALVSLIYKQSQDGMIVCSAQKNVGESCHMGFSRRTKKHNDLTKGLRNSSNSISAH